MESSRHYIHKKGDKKMTGNYSQLNVSSTNSFKRKKAETSTIQLLLWKIIHSEEEPVVKNDPQYDQLLKMVHVTSTLPKPDARVFDGNPKDYSSFMSFVETHIEENITNKKQCLAYLIDNCTEIAHESISYFIQCQDSEKAYDEAKKMLKEKSITSDCSLFDESLGSSADDLKALELAQQSTVLKNDGFEV
ncbi:hypothetical protein CAPTEDRAFT_217794 [Capitella teleta]|uniref:Uncharacterized protein n=1 Tax=Capitella teleta TaxID=283909 RepID=R7UZJ0_CAPTE|nr:hypothetical protein CAPTEDRAFT_217794 [Capitella teleta]|eukprot:ELU11694.1 hypothetical protein CAPTEDRAFT_217794 [Capitella teleta]